MPILFIKITLLFTAALLILLAMKQSTPAIRHLLCVCALAGSLVLPAAALFPARVIAIPLPTMGGVITSEAVGRAGSWSLSAVMSAIWAFGCLVLMVRLGIGHLRIARVIRAASPIEPGLLAADVSVPIACGLLRPRVLMPRASAEWPEWQFNAAVRHERMHVRRKDLWAGFIAEAACSVYWFHPLVWMIARQLRNDQEAACDDAVLFSGFESATYAQALLAVAQTSTPNLLPGCSMTNQMNLKTRITRLLDLSVARTTSRANLLRTGIGFAILLTAIGTLSPQKSSAQSAPPADKSDQIYKVGGEVTMPRVIYKVDPAYTDEAHDAKISGTVLLSVVVGADGLARDINVVKGLDAGLDRNAAEVLQQWRFAPATRNGEPVAVRATIEINFRLL